MCSNNQNKKKESGCSADTPELWQIGIDVLPEYRGRGIAKEEIQKASISP